jgi:hypothetical protein
LIFGVRAELADVALSHIDTPVFFVVHRCVMILLFSDCYVGFLKMLLGFFTHFSASSCLGSFLGDEKVLQSDNELKRSTVCSQTRRSAHTKSSILTSELPHNMRLQKCP